MRTIQGEISSIGTVSFSGITDDTSKGNSSQFSTTNQVSNVVADPAQCRVSYHWRVWRNGAAQPAIDKNAWFMLHDVSSVAVEPLTQYLNQSNAANGHANLVATSTSPPMTTVVVHTSSWVNEFPFTNTSSASRAAQTIKQAARLCGSSVAN